VRNNGCISNLPDDCVVEVPGYVDRNGVMIPRIGELPMACAATLSASVNVQRMAVHAALTGDVMLLKQAMLHDPLTAAVCDPDEVWQMTDEMLVAQAKWLPQYRREMPRARERLRHKKVKTRKWKGTARIKTRTPAEMRRHAQKMRKLAAATDKAAADRRRRSVRRRRRAGGSQVFLIWRHRGTRKGTGPLWAVPFRRCTLPEKSASLPAMVASQSSMRNPRQHERDVLPCRSND
jgi:hypothetical protein